MSAPECADTIDHVAARPAHLRHPAFGLLDQAGERHLALDVGLVPDRDAGVGQAEDADPDRRARPAAAPS